MSFDFNISCPSLLRLIFNKHSSGADRLLKLKRGTVGLSRGAQNKEVKCKRASKAYFWSINGAVAVTNCSNPDQDVGSCTCCRSVRALLPTRTTPHEEHDQHKQQQQGGHETKQTVLQHSSKCSDGVGGGCAAVTVHIRLFEAAVIHCLLGTYIISNELAYMHTCIYAYMRTA